MREPLRPAEPGEYSESATTWRTDDTIPAGTTVQATDGPLGVVVERRIGEGPEHAYLGVNTDEGLLYIPERLIRETRPGTVLLSLPKADAKAQSKKQLS
jgi:hypothetical protein